MTTLVENITTNVVQPTTVRWIGTSGDWYDSANWSTGRVPTASDIVTIQNTTKGTTYEITFSNGNPVYGGLNLLSSNGGSLKLTGLTAYQGSNESDITVEAKGVGSQIDLSDVTSLTGGKTLNVLNINALQGGQVNLGNLTKISGGTTEVLADGVSSAINLSKLTEFIDDDFDRSLLKTRNGGSINVSQVTKLEEVDLSSDNSVLYLEKLTTYTGDNNVNATNGGQISLIRLNSIVGQILQVTAAGSRSKIVISQQLDPSEYLTQEVSGGDVIVSNNSSSLNFPPLVGASLSNQRTNEDQAFNFTVPANTFLDLDPSDTLTYTATLSNGSALPSWLTFNAATRTFGGTPNNDQVGRITIAVKATDSKGSSTSSQFTLQVVNTNDAPVVSNAIADQDTTAGQTFNFTFANNTFTDPDVGDTLTYTATLANGSPLPEWLTFNPANRRFSGFPVNSDAGTLNIRVTATDRAGASVTDTFALTIAQTTGNNPPIVINSIPEQSSSEGLLYTFQIPANIFRDIDDEPLTYRATLTNGSPLPEWLTFDPETRTFRGTPSNADVGSININVSATDPSGASAVDSFTLIVEDVPNNAPVVGEPIADQSTAEDELYTFVIPATTFSDSDVGDTLTYTATLTDGTPLPSWLTFEPTTLTFSGIPTNADVNVYSIRVTATDQENASISDDFNLRVNNVNDTPILVQPISDQDAVIDQAFIYQVPNNTFTDVDPGDSLIYTATSGNGTPLPSWLTFNPTTLTFSGTPSVADYGTINLSVTALDSSGASISDVFTLDIDIDAAQYGASYPDLIEAFGYNLGALSQHYRNLGRAEGRNPDLFDENRYVASNTDLISDPTIVDPNTRLVNADAAAENYIESGFEQGRSLTSFQSDQYIASYGDLISAFGYNLTEGSIHYIQHGLVEGRAADTFDEYRYLAGYDDLLNFYGVDVTGATEHYITRGSEFSVGDEARDPLLFKPDIYIASYGDLIEAVQPINNDDYSTKINFGSQHFVINGYTEGRLRQIFDPTSYLANNPDVAADPFYANDPTRHYIEFGFAEGRVV